MLPAVLIASHHVWRGGLLLLAGGAHDAGVSRLATDAAEMRCHYTISPPGHSWIGRSSFVRIFSARNAKKALLPTALANKLMTGESIPLFMTAYFFVSFKSTQLHPHQCCLPPPSRRRSAR
ncbi:hypothetical protein EMVG_00174 [Emiliania huxleyi virus PS401]|nr:hypothetical protein EMVG_00174 [Emiliania huxleyi virus PS401]